MSWLTDLAIKYLDWIQSRELEKFKREHPEFAVDMGLRRVEVGTREYEMVMTHPGVYMLADQCAAFLDSNAAKNFVQFDMMPRLDRGIRPVRVTVQWADGESPASKCARLEKEIEQWRTRLKE